MEKKKIKICIASSAGGHLTEILQLKNLYSKYEHFYLSDYRTNAIDLSKKEKMYFVTCPRRNPLKLIASFFQSLQIFFHEQPDIVLSTGADTAFSICLITKLFRKKLIFIESFARIEEPSLSGKIFYPISDLFFIQWRENKKFFPNAIYAGPVF
ncbi:MAG: PssD/Cps14F family polysaccharide biosynthesis glycosyltransferase [Candidatus Diapherotrites archaeon]|nr:PssD/Cps14F family polysaccharide biosynthesis glycosyltransferase [Candidatus Diapherotrites archaeon]